MSYLEEKQLQVCIFCFEANFAGIWASVSNKARERFAEVYNA